MADTASLYRTQGSGHTAIEIRQPLRSYQQVSEEFGHRVFKKVHPKEHSCRVPGVGQTHKAHHWPTYLLSFGLRQTYETVDELHKKPDMKGKKVEEKEPDKMLYTVGGRGSEIGYFQFPRGLTCTDEGDIVVADSDNNRVQVFNSAGVFKTHVGQVSGGSKAGEFNRPVAAVVMRTGNIAIADQKNRRLQIMRPKGQIRFVYPTKGVPCAVATDVRHYLYVANLEREIEVYKKGGKFQEKWPLPAGGLSQIPVISMQVHDTNEELLICDTVQRQVYGYNFEGRLKWQFQPEAAREGLGMIPIGLAIDPIGQLILGDAQNHTVNAYSSAGESSQPLKELLCPTDDLGSVQQVAVSTEGHLVVTEFTANGQHNLKIFRHLDCTCHRRRENSF